ARLQLGEEADVFNGDDGLVGEGLEERDLSFAEELNLRSAELDAADGDPLSQQRNAEDRAETELPRVLDRVGKLAVFVLEVGDLYRARLEHRSASDGPADERERELSVALGDRTVMRDEGQPVAVDAEDRRVERLTQPGRALSDRVEHRLNVGRRLADDAQDLAGCRLLLERFLEAGVGRGELSRSLLHSALERGIRFFQLPRRAIQLVAQCFQLISCAHRDAMAKVARADARRAL